MESRQFHLGDVLTVVTGRLLAPRGMAAVYDILCYMTQDDLYTHQLPRAREECAPDLLRQHPHLAEVTLGEVSPDNVTQVLEGLSAEYGETLPVTPLPPHVHEYIDPASELAEKVHPGRVIHVNFRHRQPGDDVD